MFPWCWNRNGIMEEARAGHLVGHGSDDLAAPHAGHLCRVVMHVERAVHQLHMPRQPR